MIHRRIFTSAWTPSRRRFSSATTPTCADTLLLRALLPLPFGLSLLGLTLPGLDDGLPAERAQVTSRWASDPAEPRRSGDGAQPTDGGVRRPDLVRATLSCGASSLAALVSQPKSYCASQCSVSSSRSSLESFAMQPIIRIHTP